MHVTSRPRAAIPTWVYFAATGLVWGASFLFIKISVAGLSPVQVVLGRTGLGAATLVLGMLLTRTRWIRDGRVIAHLAVSGIFIAGIPLLLFAWAAQYIPSGISAIFNATTPLITLLLTAIVIPSERPHAWRTSGVFIGSAGLLIVVAPWKYLGDASLADPARIPAYLACLGATTCYAISFVYMRRTLTLADHSPIAASTIQVGGGFVTVLVASPLLGVATAPAITTPIVVSMLLLGVIGTGIAYMWNTKVNAAWGPVRTSMVTYVTPIVGVILGVLILGEDLSWNEPVGMAVVFTGIGIAQGLIREPWRSRARATPAPEATACELSA